MSSPSPVPDFIQLNDSVHVHEGEDSALAVRQGHPALIVLLSWGGAPLRNVAKYTARHRELFPQSSILLIQTEFSHILLHTASSQDAALVPAVEIVQRHVGTGANDLPGQKRLLLVHAFSHGGCYKLLELSRRYRARSGGRCMPVGALVIDSAPGISTLRETFTALSYALPRPAALRYPAMVLLAAIVLLMRLRDLVLLRGNWVHLLRRKMNDAELVDERAARCYIFSPQDRLVGWRDVQRHAEDARRAGFHVTEEQFDGSPHVSHARLDSERYWRIVTETWRSRPGQASGQLSGQSSGQVLVAA